MINLIPNQEKKKGVRSFYFRLVTVFFAALGFCALVASASILPAYFISSVNKNLAEAKLATQKKEPAEPADQSSLALMKNLDSEATIVESAEKNKYLVSQKVINEIILEKKLGIAINQISYENNPTTGKKVSIRGAAGSRDQLLLFSRALEDNPAFKKVDLPISNFVKGSNFEFSLNLIPS